MTRPSERKAAIWIAIGVVVFFALIIVWNLWA